MELSATHFPLRTVPFRPRTAGLRLIVLTTVLNLSLGAQPALAITAQRAAGLVLLASNHDKGALQRLTRAAREHDATAQEWLGNYYAFHAKNFRAAVPWWKKAALSGSPTAAYNVGICYEQGKGVPAEARQAVFWYERAAAAQYPQAEVALGDAYSDGRGVPRGYAQGVYWYRKAAIQGFAQGQYSLGIAYDFGYGVPQNYARAIYWYRQAATQGHALAQYYLGDAYAKGHGVPKDVVRAYALYNLAAASGARSAYDARAQLTKTMNVLQINAGQQLSEQLLNSKDFLNTLDGG